MHWVRWKSWRISHRGESLHATAIKKKSAKKRCVSMQVCVICPFIYMTRVYLRLNLLTWRILCIEILFTSEILHLFTGWIYDVSGSYFAAFILFAILGLIAFALQIAVIILHRRRHSVTTINKSNIEMSKIVRWFNRWCRWGLVMAQSADIVIGWLLHLFNFYFYSSSLTHDCVK